MKDKRIALATSLPWRMMRSIFLAGVDDMTDKPYDPANLIIMAPQALEAIVLRKSYQTVDREVL